MITLTQMPTAQQVTNLYLYGGLEALGDKVDAGLIRGNTSTPLNVDVNAYMSGPGRFASPSKFELVEKFMSPWLHPESLNLAPGTYTKEQLFSALGISVGYVTIDQSMYDDSKDDFLSRAYIWNTTAFKIHSGARFVVEANGKRHIENFAIVPHSNDNDRENFDFEAGTGFGGLANSLLQPKVDPSNIGRKVFFTFTGDVATTQFSFEDYVGASNTAVIANPLLYASIVANATAFLDDLYNSGSTRFLDADGRFVFYGTDGADTLAPANFDNVAIDSQLRIAMNDEGVAIVAGNGHDSLVGGIRGDALYGGAGDDHLNGERGADYLEGGEEADVLLGGEGNDRLYGSTGADTLDGGSGDDHLDGGADSDTLNGMAGNDHLEGGAGDDVLEGGADNDTLYGGTGHDTYRFDEINWGHDVILDIDGAGRIQLGGLTLAYSELLPDSSDVWTDSSETYLITRSSTNLFITRRDGSSTGTLVVRNWSEARNLGVALEKKEDDEPPPPGQPGLHRQDDKRGSVLVGTSLDDRLSGSGSYSFFMGGDGSDSLMFGSRITAFGGAGDDFLVSIRGTLNSTIDGGEGNDTFRIFGSANTISGDEGNDLMHVSGDDNMLSGGAGNDNLQLSLTDCLRNTLDGGEGDDVLDASYKNDNTLIGGAGNDTITSLVGKNTIVFNRGDGEDIVIADAQATLELRGIGSSQVRFERSIGDVPGRTGGSDLVIHVIGGDGGKVTVVRYFLDDPFFPLRPVLEFSGDVLSYEQVVQQMNQGGDGSDLLRGADDIPNRIQGAGGNDMLFAGESNTTFVFNRGDGHDTVHETIASRKPGGVNQDVLELGAGLTPAATQVVRGAIGIDINNLTLDFGEGDRVTLENYFVEDFRLQTIRFADGTEWDHADVSSLMMFTDPDAAMAGNDVLLGDAGNNVFNGGAGVDILIGNGGNDTYLFGRGDGQDMVAADTLAEANKLNVLQFKAGVVPGDIVLSRMFDTLVLSIAGTSDNVTVMSFFLGSSVEHAANPVQQVRFANGTIWSLATILANLQASEGPRYLIGQGGAETLTGAGGDDILLGEGGSDVLWGMAGMDVFDGGSGDDLMVGGLGNDVYLFGWGDGRDVVAAEAGDGPDQLNILQFKEGVRPADVLFDRADKALVFSLAGSSDSITFNDFFHANPAVSPLQRVLFADGSAWTAAQILDSLTEDNLPVLVNHAPVMAYSLPIQVGAAGAVLTYTVPTGVFVDADADDALAFSAKLANGDDLPTWLNFDSLTRTLHGTPPEGGADQVAVRITATDMTGAHVSGLVALYIQPDYASPVHSGVTQTLADGYLNLVLTGSNAIDGTGNAEDNHLTGNAASNTLDGLGGNDVLSGGGGNDTYRFGRGDGQDTILAESSTEPAQLNTLQFKDGVVHADIVLSQVGDALLFTFADSSDSITANAFFDNTNAGFNSVQQVRFADGSSWDIPDLLEILANGGRYLPPNEVPQVAQPLADQSVLEGTALTCAIPTGAFTDADAGDVLTYTAHLSNGSALPEWLSFDAATRTLSGTPPTGTDADLSIRITATDPAGASASSLFTLNIEPDYTSPVLSPTTHTLADHYLNLTLTGTAAIYGTGNSEANQLTGNSAANVLSGGSGDDTYVYSLGGGTDTLIELTGQGHDTLRLGEGISPTPTSTRASREGTDLILSFGAAGTTDQVRMTGYFDQEGGTVETIAFANGQAWDFHDALYWTVFAETPATKVKYFLKRLGGEVLDLAHPVIGLGQASSSAIHIVTGGAGADVLYVGAGMRADARMMGSGADSIYFTGRLDDYLQAIDQDSGVYTLAHRTRQSEVIQFTSMGDSDVLYFQDGHIVFNANDDARLYDVDAETFMPIEASFLLPGGTTLNAPDATLAMQGITGTTLSATLSRPLATVLTDAQAQGTVSAGTPMQIVIKGTQGQDLVPLSSSGQALTVTGGSGADSVYVTPGTAIDARVLGPGDDRIYFTGQFNDYTQSIDQDSGVYTFTHQSRPTEVVKLTSMGQNDELWFADGHIVFNANADERLYDVNAEAFTAVQTSWLSAGGTPLLTERLEVSSDGGATWQDATSSVNGATVTLSEPTLGNGSTFQLRVASQMGQGAVTATQVTGSGDDVVLIGTAERASLANSSYDGGAGTDTLALKSDQSGVLLDLTAYGQTTFTGIERLDLTGGGNNTAKLTIDQLLHMPDAGEDRLIVLGDAGDAVQLVGGSGSWSSAGTQNWQGLDYAVYAHSGAAGRELLVQQGVLVV